MIAGRSMGRRMWIVGMMVLSGRVWGIFAARARVVYFPIPNLSLFCLWGFWGWCMGIW